MKMKWSLRNYMYDDKDAVNLNRYKRLTPPCGHSVYKKVDKGVEIEIWIYIVNVMSCLTVIDKELVTMVRVKFGEAR